VDAALRLANAVSITDRGVRLSHATGDEVSRCGVSEQPATINNIVALAIQAPMVRRLDTSESESNGGNDDDAGGQHQDFGKVKARKYRYFRHGYFPQVPDTDDRKPPERGEIVLREPRRGADNASGFNGMGRIFLLPSPEVVYASGLVAANCKRTSSPVRSAPRSSA